MQSRAVQPAKQAGPVLQKGELNQWPGSSNTTTFVRCLRLLDLDQLPDWPGITDNVFTSKAAQQNLQARIKAVEWSLYRLFEVYNPKETQMVGLYEFACYEMLSTEVTTEASPILPASCTTAVIEPSSRLV